MNKIFHPNIDELCGRISARSTIALTPLIYSGAARSVWTSSIKHGHPCSVSGLPWASIALRPTTYVTDMINIFEVFLPQLLRYPNPSDPLNGEAAALLMRHPKEYEQRVKGMGFFASVFLWLKSDVQNMCNDTQRKRRLTRLLEKRGRGMMTR